MTPFAHYYHIYTVECEWKAIVAEHLNALVASGLADNLDELYIGVIGEPATVNDVCNFCNLWIKTRVIAHDRQGWEQVTLSKLWVYPHGDKILYAHTKGVFDLDSRIWNAQWRNGMLHAVVWNWQQCVNLLDTHDAVGCHWLTHEEFPTMVQVPFFGGNYWWVNRDFIIDHCDAPSLESRHEAEAWLGRCGLRNTYDLAPGWPSPNTVYKG